MKQTLLDFRGSQILEWLVDSTLHHREAQQNNNYEVKLLLVAGFEGDIVFKLLLGCEPVQGLTVYLGVWVHEII